LETRMYISL